MITLLDTVSWYPVPRDITGRGVKQCPSINDIILRHSLTEHRTTGDILRHSLTVHSTTGDKKWEGVHFTLNHYDINNTRDNLVVHLHSTQAMAIIISKLLITFHLAKKARVS